MERNGYTFGGWYKDEACTDGNEFEFGDYLHDNTNIYAKWIPNLTAPYTVVFWTQNAARTSYDVAGSYVGSGTVGDEIPVSIVAIIPASD